MASVPGLVLCLVALFHLLARVRANMEGDALNSLKSNLNDPNNVLQSWDPTLANPCTWFHVTCNSDNNVMRVDLGNAALSGTLVPQLGLLKHLQYLELLSNNISGKIPNELGNLRSLVSLDLYLNRFTGPIPDTLGKLTKLRFLEPAVCVAKESVGHIFCGIFILTICLEESIPECKAATGGSRKH